MKRTERCSYQSEHIHLQLVCCCPLSEEGSAHLQAENKSRADEFPTKRTSNRTTSVLRLYGASRLIRGRTGRMKQVLSLGNARSILQSQLIRQTSKVTVNTSDGVAKKAPAQNPRPTRPRETSEEWEVLEADNDSASGWAVKLRRLSSFSVGFLYYKGGECLIWLPTLRMPKWIGLLFVNWPVSTNQPAIVGAA